MITKVAFIAQPTKDMAASRRFYGKVLGLKNTASYEDKWAEFDTPEGKSIALDTFSPQGTGTYLSLETDDIEAELRRLRRQGVPVVMDLMDNNVCKMAIVSDPAGNKVMLHQMSRECLAARKAAAFAQAKPARKTAAAKTASKRAKPAASRGRAKAKRSR